MKIKKLFCLIAAGVMAVSSFAGNALAYYNDADAEPYDFAPRTKIGGFTYLLKDYAQYGSVRFTYSATVTDIPNIKKVEIPEKVTYNGTEFTVTDVDLSNSPVVDTKYYITEEIVLPESIYNITALYGFQNLKKVNLPNKALIARDYDSLSHRYTNTDFSDYFGNYSLNFTCCPNLKLSVDPNNPYYSYKNDMLFTKDGKKLLLSLNKSTDITIPNGVEELLTRGGYGFSHVKNVKLPDTLTYLGGIWSSITKITLPDSLEEIGMDVFSHSKITKITLPKNLKTIGIGAFCDTKLTKIVIPDSVKEILEDTFLGSKIKSVKFGKNLTSIGVRAFKGCNNLKSVTIPKNVQRIEQGAFRNCKKLKNVKILSENAEIRSWSFADCKNLKNITIKGAKDINANFFDNSKKLSKIAIKNKKKAPKILCANGFKNTKKGIKFVVKNKKVAKQLKKQLSKKKYKKNLKNAKILVGKKVVYKV